MAETSILIFQFEHMGLWDKGEEKPLDLIELKTILTNWQNGLEKNQRLEPLYI